VRERAKHLILDGVACALVGPQLPVSRAGVKAVTALDGAGDAALIGWGSSGRRFLYGADSYRNKQGHHQAPVLVGGGTSGTPMPIRHRWLSRSVVGQWD
jgi:hypothetical protein